uniref:DUF5050 domain-containing protein n=1 Tax=candidate division WOR-3 bacterium TaxID=2052148 RepID=A0A7C4TGY3_UNCW3
MKRKNYLVGILLLALLISTCKPREDIKEASEAIKKGRYSAAIKSLKSLLMIDSLNPEIHFNLSLAYCYLDSVEKAYQHFLKLVELNSSLKDSIELKLLLAKFLKIEPYASSPIPMAKMNQFKGSFGPDNELLAVAAAKIDIADIYLLKLDGTLIKKITSKGMNTDPAFSPLGDKIAYVSNIDGDEEIYLYDLKNDTTIKLTDNTYTDFSPSFSPKGNEIVYVTDRDKNWEIYKISLKDKFALRLTKNKFWDGFPSFTPDGGHIVFSSKRNGSEDIYIMNSNGTNERLLFATKFDETDPHLIGENLFFRSNRDGEFEIYKFNIKTQKILRLTFNEVPDWNPRVAPDGTKILFSRKIKNKWQLYFLNLSSSISAEVIAQKIKEIQTP